MIPLQNPQQKQKGHKGPRHTCSITASLWPRCGRHSRHGWTAAGGPPRPLAEALTRRFSVCPLSRCGVSGVPMSLENGVRDTSRTRGTAAPAGAPAPLRPAGDDIERPAKRAAGQGQFCRFSKTHMQCRRCATWLGKARPPFFSQPEDGGGGDACPSHSSQRLDVPYRRILFRFIDKPHRGITRPQKGGLQDHKINNRPNSQRKRWEQKARDGWRIAGGRRSGRDSGRTAWLRYDCCAPKSLSHYLSEKTFLYFYYVISISVLFFLIKIVTESKKEP